MMLGIELQQTRVYQEAKAEGKAEGRAEGKTEGESIGLERGRAEGELKLLMKLLTRRLGKIDHHVQLSINNLSIEQVESLGEALLDFNQMSDLMAWLEKNR